MALDNDDSVNLNDKNQAILDDPFLGADADEENPDEGVNTDYGNDFVDPDVDPPVVEDETPPVEDDETPPAEEEDDTDKGDEVNEDETPDTDEEEPPAAPEKKQNQDQRIPKKRFDEVNVRMQEAEAKLLALKNATSPVVTDPVVEYDYDGKEKAYMEAVVDGEFDVAQGIRKEIRQAERDESNAAIAVASEGARANAKKDLAFGEIVVEIEGEYPMLVEGKEGYDEDLVTEVLDLHEGFLNKGLTPEKAMRKAVKYVAKMNDLVSVTEQEAAEATPPTDKVGEKPASKTDSKKKVVAKTTQPEKLPRTTAEKEATNDMSQMTEEEFDSLPESKKKELRGDFDI